MTENEAIERLKCMRLFMQINDKANKSKFLEEDYIANKMVIKALEEIRQYRAIGTIEECREAREKQKGKKPIKYGDTRQGLDNDGNSISWQEDCYECPTCGSFLGYVSDCEDEQYQDGYCRNCGQSILWEEE